MSSLGGSRPGSAAGAASVSNPMLEFESLGVLGRGRYSEVLKVRHRVSGEICAMKKVAIFEMDTDGRKECINEANILQALPSHPHIIQYKHSFLYENDLYLILELAEQGDIGNLLQSQRQKGSYFQEAEIWHYFVQIVDALAVMHACRVMHRDIKPANVFLTSSPAAAASAGGGTALRGVGILAPGKSDQWLGQRVKLGDLGLGRHMSSKTNEAFSMVGTPFYMSPEAIANSGYDFKSDIWSVGCLLYELCALKSPFYSPANQLNFYTLGKKITQAEYEKLPQHFSKTLHRLVHWLLQPSPEDRPDISAVLRVALAACESIATTGTVRDEIVVAGPAPRQAQQQQQQQQQQAVTSMSD